MRPAPAGLEESQLLCCELPAHGDGLPLLTGVPSRQLDIKQGSQSYNLKESNLANHLNELDNEFFPQSP